MESNVTINFDDKSKEESFKKDFKIREEDKKKQKFIEDKKSIFWFFFEYYKDWYIDDNGHPIPDFFRDYAQGVVEKISPYSYNSKKHKWETATKVRQYYNIVNDLYQSNKKPSQEKLYLMLAKSNYDIWRNKMTKPFWEFLRLNIDMIFDKQLWGIEDKTIKFEIFKKHFEAVLCYSKGMLKD